MGKGIINRANVAKTIRYLRKNGIKHAFYAAKERLEEAGKSEYCYISPDKETLEAQRRSSGRFPYRFSIVVPAYETKEKYLREMLDSVMEQSYDNWELLIVDASKSDCVRGVVEEYSRKLKPVQKPVQADNAKVKEWKEAVQKATEQAEVLRTETIGGQSLKYIKLPDNKGISENTNVGIEAATGDYIGLLDHDDLLSPDALYEMALCLERAETKQKSIKNSPVILYSNEDKYENNIRIVKDSTYEDSIFTDPNKKQEFNLDLILSNNYICHMMIVRAEEMKKLLLRKEYDGAQDYDLVLRLVGSLLNNGMNVTALDKYILHVPKVLYHWRCHEDSTAQNTDSKAYAYEAGKRALEDFGRAREWQIRVTHELHLGFYRVEYLPEIFTVRPEVGMVGGRILDRHNKITSGIYNEKGEKLYFGLHREYSGGSTHIASLAQDCAAVDIRCLRLREELKPLFEELLGFPYKETGKEKIADVSALSCDEAGYRKLSLALGEAIKSKGYLVLWDPKITIKI